MQLKQHSYATDSGREKKHTKITKRRKNSLAQIGFNFIVHWCASVIRVLSALTLAIV